MAGKASPKHTRVCEFAFRKKFKTTVSCDSKTNALLPRCSIKRYGNSHTVCVVLYKLPSSTEGMKRPSSFLNYCFEVLMAIFRKLAVNNNPACHNS